MSEPRDEPRNLITDEMLSAYVDDELSDDERRRVEQVVAQDPHYAQLLQQLQSLRDALHDLPVQRPDDQFARRVMQRIGTAQIEPHRTSGDHSATLSAASHAETNGHDAAGPAERDWRRPLIWSALALAAALLVMVFAPDTLRTGRNRNVATAPQQAQPAEQTVEELSASGKDDHADLEALYKLREGRAEGMPPHTSERDAVEGVTLEDVPGLATGESESLRRPLDHGARFGESWQRRSRRGANAEFRSGITPEQQVITPEQQVIADNGHLGATSPAVVIQADTTAAQLSDLLAQLRTDQIPVSLLNLTAAEEDVRAFDATGPVDALRRDAGDELVQLGARLEQRESAAAEQVERILPDRPIADMDLPAVPPAPTLQLYVVEASPEQVRESLAQANIRGERADSGQLGRLNLYFAVESNTSDAGFGRRQQTIVDTPASASAETAADSRDPPNEPAQAAPPGELFGLPPVAADDDQRRGSDVAATDASADRAAASDALGAALASEDAPPSGPGARQPSRRDRDEPVAGGTAGQAGQAGRAVKQAAVRELEAGSTAGPPPAPSAAPPVGAVPSSAARTAEPTAQRVLLLLRIVDRPADPTAPTPSAAPAAPTEPAEPDR